MSVRHEVKSSASLALVKMVKRSASTASQTIGPTASASTASAAISGGKWIHEPACSSGTAEIRACSPRFVCTSPGQSTDTPMPSGRSERASASEYPYAANFDVMYGAQSHEYAQM